MLSGRTNDEVKADPERMWRSDLPPAEASVPVGDGTAADRGGRAAPPKQPADSAKPAGSAAPEAR